MGNKIQNLKIAKNKFNNSVFIEWDDLEEASKYKIKRTDEGGEQLILSQDIQNNHYKDEEVEKGARYWYSIGYYDENENEWVEQDQEIEYRAPQYPVLNDSTNVVKRFLEKISLYKKIIASVVFVSVFYVLFITNVEYVSNTKIILKETNSQPSANALMSIVNPAISNQNQNVKVLETFLYSRDLYRKLDQKFNLREYYSSKNINFYERLYSGYTIEEAINLHISKLDYIYDMENDIIDIEYYHTDPKMAKEILEFINKELMVLINDMNKRTSEKKLSMIKSVIDKAEEDYKEGKRELEVFQQKYKTISPKDDLIKRVEITIGLERQIEELDNKIKEKSIYMNEGYYEVTNMQKLKKEYEEKLAKRVKSLIGVEKGNVNAVINNYEELAAKVQLLQTIYADALVKQNNTRLDLEKEKLIMEIITNPTLGESYEAPNKPLTIFSILALTFMFSFIINVLYTIMVREK